MSYHVNATSAHGSGGVGTETRTSCNFKRRRIMCSAAPTATVQVSNFCPLAVESNDLCRSTVCMDCHILSRIEDDLRRAAIRQDNPESAIPSRGYEYDQEACRIIEEYHTIRLLSSGNLPDKPYSFSSGKGLLPCIKSLPTRSRRSSVSNSRRPSRSSSAANTDTSNYFSVAPSHNIQEKCKLPMCDWSCRANSSLCGSPLQRRGSSPAYLSKPPHLSNVQLKPIGLACKTPTRQSKKGDDSEGGSKAGSAHMSDKQLYSNFSDLTESECRTVKDIDRERRLRLADEVASLMESAAL